MFKKSEYPKTLQVFTPSYRRVVENKTDEHRFRKYQSEKLGNKIRVVRGYHKVSPKWLFFVLSVVVGKIDLIWEYFSHLSH